MLAVRDGIMPPWQADNSCNEYVGDRSLTEAQKALFISWVEAGSPEGNPAAEADPMPDDSPRLSRVDLTLEMAAAYTPTRAPDDYRCFVMPWPEEYTRTKYVTGFGAVPGNDKTVHHVIAFLATPEQAAEYYALDEAEDGPGYTCFAGTNGPARAWLGGWAPGGLGSDLPTGTGIEVAPGSMIILQVHYNVIDPNPDADRTSIQLKLDDQVERVAQVVPWTNPQWIDSEQMMIPAGDDDVMHTWQFDPTPFLGMGDAIELHSAALHMHTLGTSGTLSIDRAAGGSDCLLDIPKWDFDWQGSYGLQAPMRLERGDQLRIECHWDNSPENQTIVNGEPKLPQNVTWGEGTADEMCLGIFLVTAAD
jgi:hypothetical protein